MARWADAEQRLVALAAGDLRAGWDSVAPCLLAFAGDQPRFAAFVREFEPGGYVQPLTELLALAAPLDADRLALSLSGRAWSLDDPIPPVTADADLRQHVLCIELVDGSRGRPRRTSVLWPFEPPGRSGEDVRWGERQELSGGQGWIGDALTFAASSSGRRRLRASDDAIAEQAVRVMALGHELLLAEDLVQRLGLAGFVA